MTTTPQVPGALTAMAISSFNCAVRAALHRYDTGTLDFAESLDAIEIALNTVRPEPAAAPAAGEPAKQWPFVETPGEFTQRLEAALLEFGALLPAVRNVLIENPPALAAATPSVPHKST
jgi:hypothetical protein